MFHAFIVCADSVIATDAVLAWLRDQVSCYGIEVADVGAVFSRGDVLCAIIHRFRPDLIEFPLPSEENVSPLETAEFRNQVAFDLLQSEYTLSPPVSVYIDSQFNFQQNESIFFKSVSILPSYG